MGGMSGELLLINVGNSRVRMAAVVNGALQPGRALAVGTPAELLDACAAAARALTGSPQREPAVVMASVNDPVADPLAEALAGLTTTSGRRCGLVRVPRGLGVPIVHHLPEPVTVGVDRLLAALAAFERSGQACAVIDAGTAITVDLVDDQGVFRGGVIAPGLRVMLASLHEHTAALPRIEPEEPGPDGVPPPAPGLTTAQAMQRGCVAACRGLVRQVVEHYAELCGRYPRVIATGGDAPRLFAGDDLIEHIVPDLVLMGLHSTYTARRPGAGATT